jgi:hypothetical protein
MTGYYTENTWSYSNREPISNIAICPEITQLQNLMLSFVSSIGEPCGFGITVANASGTEYLDRSNSKKFQINGISKQNIIDILNQNWDLVLHHRYISFSIWGISKGDSMENVFFGEGLKVKGNKCVDVVTRSGSRILQLLESFGIERLDRTTNNDLVKWNEYLAKSVDASKTSNNIETSFLDGKAIIDRFYLFGLNYVEWDDD